MRAAERMKNQHGYTLLEIMIAMVIGLFLLGGLLAIEQSNKSAFIGQNQLSRLQDSERVAMTLLNDVIQSAGYFPDPVNNTVLSALPAAGTFVAGQAITGTHSASGDTISVRYMTANGDGIFNCSGSSNSSGVDQIYTNDFSVSNGQLVCSVGGTTYPLVGTGTGIAGIDEIQVQKLTVVYGVKTSAASDSFNVDSYLDADQVKAGGYWGDVTSVVVTLDFKDPLGQVTTISVKRTIGIMNRMGVKI